MNFFDLGGLLMWPIAFLGILALLFFIERALALHRGHIKAIEFVEGVKNLLRKRRLVEALALCNETQGPISNVVKAVLLNYDKKRAEIELSVEAVFIVEIPFLERRIASIAAIAKIAPYLGLIGTIFALIKAFYLLQEQGSYLSAGGFSHYVTEALATTLAGFCVSAFAYLSYHFLYSRVKALLNDMNWASHETMQFILTDLPEHTNSK